MARDWHRTKEHSEPFTAGYDGWCPECGEEIAADVDQIVMRNGEAIHEECV